jgi:hypothetical protein
MNRNGRSADPLRAGMMTGFLSAVSKFPPSQILVSHRSNVFSTAFAIIASSACSREWPQEQERKAVTMRKLIYSIGAIVVAAVAIFIWSQTALAPSLATTASMVGFPQRTAVSPATAATISPADMMLNHKAPLRAEQWDAF